MELLSKIRLNRDPRVLTCILLIIELQVVNLGTWEFHQQILHNISVQQLPNNSLRASLKRKVSKVWTLSIKALKIYPQINTFSNLWKTVLRSKLLYWLKMTLTIKLSRRKIWTYKIVQPPKWSFLRGHQVLTLTDKNWNKV